MKHFVLFILSILIAVALSNDAAFAHGVHSGMGGCPVNACGMTDWHYLQFMKDVMFLFTLIVYGLIFGIFLISATGTHKTRIR